MYQTMAKEYNEKVALKMRKLTQKIPNKKQIQSDPLLKRIDGVKFDENHEKVAQLF